MKSKEELNVGELNYDFDNLVDRFDHGSSKWENAKRMKNILSDANLSGELFAVSTADMDFKMAPEIVEAIRETASRLVYGYTVPTKEYFDSVISWLSRRHDVEVDSNWIVLSPGVVAAIQYAISAFTNSGDGVIVQMPVYRPFHASVNALGRRLINNALLRDGNNYQIDFDDLELKASDSETKMLIFCNPHNPIGRVWTKDELEKVASICARHDVLVVSDEIHADIVFPPYKHASYCSLSPELFKNAIVCTSPSKSFNMCGLQISNIIVPNKKIRQHFAQQSHNSGFHSPNCFAATATIAAYNKAEKWFDQLLKYIHSNHELVKRFIETNIPQVDVFPLQGTYLQWLNFEAFGICGIDRERLFHDNGIFFESGYIFGEGGESFERLNLAYSKSFLNNLLKKLQKGISKKHF
ncbi:MAG: pyridoxal phosphate-dependent aminotransferase [Planctomycetaceae bacterium]|jgi:putative C-S lyase|nr:pyridoxal phosphate-dependent aminotransferase [Planctomycetaceae bacterium]